MEIAFIYNNDEQNYLPKNKDEVKNNTESNSGAPVFSTDSFYDHDVIISIDKGLDGGAIYTKNCDNKYIDCSFSKCIAYRYGGAICDIDPKSVTITGCKFDKNSAQQGSSYSLSGLNEITVSNTIFTQSTQYAVRPEFLHSSSLGLLRVNKTTIDNCQFIDFEQPEAYLEASTLTINNCKFNQIYVFISRYHSAMLAHPLKKVEGKFVLNNISFNDCHSVSAGLMNISDVSLTMENVNMTSCKNTIWNSHGIIITDSNTEKTVSIKNCRYQNCQSNKY